MFHRIVLRKDYLLKPVKFLFYFYKDVVKNIIIILYMFFNIIYHIDEDSKN